MRFDQVSLDLCLFLKVLSCSQSHSNNDSCNCSLEGAAWLWLLSRCKLVPPWV